MAINNPPLAGITQSQGFYSFQAVIDDDSVEIVEFKGTSGHAFVSNNSSTHRGGCAWVRGSSAFKEWGAGTFESFNGPLTGTTGTDGNTTIGMNAGLLYLENRTGATKTYTVTLLTDNISVE